MKHKLAKVGRGFGGLTKDTFQVVFDPAYVIKYYAIILFIVWLFASHNRIEVLSRLWRSQAMLGYSSFAGFHARHLEVLGNILSILGFIFLPFTTIVYDLTLGQIEQALFAWPTLFAFGFIGWILAGFVLTYKAIKWMIFVLCAPVLDIVGFIIMSIWVLIQRHLANKQQPIE